MMRFLLNRLRKNALLLRNPIFRRWPKMRARKNPQCIADFGELSRVEDTPAVFSRSHLRPSPKPRISRYEAIFPQPVNAKLSIVYSLVIFAYSSYAWALNSCTLERPSEVVSFDQGSSQPGPLLSSNTSDPAILLRSTSNSESLTLGLGGALTLKFTVPIANYPAAGALTIERAPSALPCASYPVRAEISGSIDGIHFVPLGTTCESASFDLGTFSWIAYLRIKDVTDTTDPAFGSQPVSGFDLRSVTGPGCLKYAYCPVSSPPDTTVTSSQKSYDLSLSHIGDDFVLEEGASFQEYGNGTARLVATAHRTSDPSSAYDMIVSLTGRVTSPPSGSPVLELDPPAYSGSIDLSSWYYYKRWSGVLLGKGSLSGETIVIGDTVQAVQIGFGAHGRNISFGAGGSFAYGPTPSQNIGDLKISLTTCSAPPSPTPPSATPQPTRTIRHGPTPHATPGVTPQPTPRFVSPTPTPSGETQIEPPNCTESDLTNKLLALDNELFRRLDTINRATRLLIRENRSRRNFRYRASIRSQIQNLYVLAWQDIWRHDRVIRSCSPSTLCFDIHLEPTQATMAASARTLDSTVENTLSYVRKRLTSRKAVRALRRLNQIHLEQHIAFVTELALLPHHSTKCREQA